MWKRAMSIAVLALACTSLVVGIATPAAAAPATPAFGPAIDAYAAFDPQDTCDPTNKPGVVSFKNLLAETYGSRWWNIARACNSEAGTSEHKEGRALDYNFDVGDPAERAQADDLLAWLLATDQYGNQHAMARRLGIMYIIWNRQVWGAYRASEGWRPYTGSNPHTDHIHFSFSWDGALERTTWWTARQANTAVATAVYNGEFHVVGRAGNGSVVHTWFDGVWHTENLGGIIQGSPSIVVFNGQFHVIGGNGGLVFQTWFNGSTWQPWQHFSSGHDPVAAVYRHNGVDELHVVSRAGNGSVVHTWFDGVWHTGNLGGIIQGRPALAIYNGQFHVIGANGGLVFQTWFSGTTWFPWQQMSAGSNPTAIVYPHGGTDELHISSRAANLNVIDAWYDGTWHTQTLNGFA